MKGIQVLSCEDLVDKRGGTKSLRQDAEELKRIELQMVRGARG
mgnify:CR=1 FL=1